MLPEHYVFQADEAVYVTFIDFQSNFVLLIKQYYENQNKRLNKGAMLDVFGINIAPCRSISPSSWTYFCRVCKWRHVLALYMWKTIPYRYWPIPQACLRLLRLIGSNQESTHHIVVKIHFTSFFSKTGPFCCFWTENHSWKCSSIFFRYIARRRSLIVS